MSVKSWFTRLGTIGESGPFVAFNAHCWFAAFVVLTASHWLPLSWVVGASLILAGGKEFVLDLQPWFETAPPQTLLDSWHDFTGYATGCAIGSVAHFIVLWGTSCGRT